jgi:hypothetical protein
MTPIPRPFQLHVADEVLQDLDARLGRVRWPDEPPLETWSTGTSVAYLRTLVDYWRDGFDWRAREAMLNRFRQFTVPLAGIDLHFIHEAATSRPWNSRRCWLMRYVRFSDRYARASGIEH